MKYKKKVEYLEVRKKDAQATIDKLEHLNSKRAKGYKIPGSVNK